jgi:hypothetical protein
MERPMETSVIMQDLRKACGLILARPGLSREVGYRVRKLADRVSPVADRVYLKTLKGREILLRCAEKAKIVNDHLDGDEDLLYQLLTDLEMTCEGLLKQAYEFRIKAG